MTESVPASICLFGWLVITRFVLNNEVHFGGDMAKKLSMVMALLRSSIEVCWVVSSGALFGARR